MFSIGHSGESPSVTELEIMTEDSMQRVLAVKTSLYQMQQGSESPCWEHREKDDKAKLMIWKNELVIMIQNRSEQAKLGSVMAKEKIAFKEIMGLEKLLSVLTASTDFTFETLRMGNLTRQKQGSKKDFREEAVLLSHSKSQQHIQEQIQDC